MIIISRNKTLISMANILFCIFFKMDSLLKTPPTGNSTKRLDKEQRVDKHEATQEKANCQLFEPSDTFMTTPGTMSRVLSKVDLNCHNETPSNLDCPDLISSSRPV